MAKLMKSGPKMPKMPGKLPSKLPAMPMSQPGYMANGGLVGDSCAATGPSGGTGGTRSRQDYRK